MQQGMLFHHLMEPHSGVDIQQLVVDLPEEIDAGRLEAAWQWLAQRHDVLRARFIWEGLEQPEQEIATEILVPFVVEDARPLSEPDQRERFASFLKTDRLLGFELDRAPMLRLTLFQWGEASFTLVWTFHHALLDGRCYPMLLREAFGAYLELAQGGITARTPPPPYRRYIDWLQQQDPADAGSYWKELLNGFQAPTPLVIDHQAPVEAPLYQQGEAWEILDSDLTDRLRAFAKDNQLTLNALVMGAWGILLHRYSGDEDIVFGATRACRKSTVAGADDMIGLFINTLPVRLRLNGEDGALSVFKAARQQWLDMRPYEHTPLVQVKAASQVPPTQPLFETLLVFENYRLDRAMPSLGGAWTKRRVQLHRLTAFPIRLLAYDGQELSFKIEFDRRRLEDAAISRMLGHLRQLLEGIVTNPTETVGRLPMLADAECQELLVDANTTRVEVPKRRTIREWIETQVESTPDGVALTCEGTDLTYRELNHRANQVAHHLKKLGVGPDVLVGVFLERSIELVVGLLGILKAGGAYLPLDAVYPKDRIAFMLEDADVPVLLTQSTLAAQLPDHRSTVVSLDTDVLDREPGTNPAWTSTPENLAYVIYTSGSTGRPKGVMVTHQNVVRLFTETERWFHFGPSDVWTLFHSYAFDFSVWEIFGALLYGGRLVIVPYWVSRSPKDFLELLCGQRVTVLNQTPSAFRELIREEAQSDVTARSVRLIIFGGEALDFQSLRSWFERHGDQHPQLVNMYGITETTVHVTYRPLHAEDMGVNGSLIGRAIPDLQLYILDPRLQLVPFGVCGEIFVGGEGLARGYLNRPDLTADRFIPNPFSSRAGDRLYRTGDLARRLPNGEIEYLGRIDHQVKLRGFRIELQEIEAALAEHPAVREAVVSAREDLPGQKRLVAYLITRGPTPDVRSLRELLHKTLPEYMVPAAFVFLEKLPLTASGKVDRRALPAPEQPPPELAGRFVPPATEMERQIATVWQNVLGLERVSVDEHFFDLGGHSLLLVQVHGRLREMSRTEFPIVTLFEHPTIRSLALHLSQRSSAPLDSEQLGARVLRQKQALAQLRMRAKG